MIKYVKKHLIDIFSDNFIFIITMMVFNASTIGANMLMHSKYVFGYDLDQVLGSGAIFFSVFTSVCFWMAGIPLIALLTIVINYIPSYVLRKILKTCILLLSALVFFVDVFLQWQFHDILDQAKIEIILTTDQFTSLEFIQNYIMNIKLIGVVLVLLLIAFSIVHIVMRRFIKYKNVVCNMFFIATIAGGVVVSALFIKSIVMEGRGVVSVSSVRHALTRSTYFNFVLFRTCLDFISATQSVGSEKTIFEAMDSNTEKPYEINDGVPKVVFILGESIDRNHMGIYGYRLDTTPYSRARSENKELYIYSDVIAPGNGTNDVMRMIYNFAEKGSNTNEWYKYPNVIDIINKTDYYTIWISNQPPTGAHSNLDKIFANRCKDYMFTLYQGGAGSGAETNLLDETILPLLDESIAKRYSKQVFFVHTMGAHEVYSKRYPSSFNVFTSSDEIFNNKKYNIVGATYDNAVLYSDYIFDEIIKRFENDDAIIIYTSDHGMELYDGRDFAGHSSEAHGNRHMIEVPFIIWTSEQCKKNHPNLVKQIYESKDKPFRTDNLIHVILDIVGVKTKSYDSKKSVVNPSYVPLKRIYNNKEYIK